MGLVTRVCSAVGPTLAQLTDREPRRPGPLVTPRPSSGSRAITGELRRETRLRGPGGPPPVNPANIKQIANDCDTGAARSINKICLDCDTGAGDFNAGVNLINHTDKMAFM